jgi:hypothetical protein
MSQRLDSGQRVCIRKGWEQAGRKGTVLAHFGQQQFLDLDLGQDWVAIKWDNADDPDNFKAVALELIPSEDRRWPRPWKARSLMIVDARDQEVLHLGGIRVGNKIGVADETCDLVKLIVEGVNTVAALQSTDDVLK